jgi:Coenzyme PQQ synthesis protein D (PqqD)
LARVKEKDTQMPTDDTASSPRYGRNPAVLAASLGPEETALLGQSRDNYYGLNGPASRIWQLLEAPRTLDEICAVLTAEFEVDPQECARDTQVHLAELVAHGLAIAMPPVATRG